MRVFPLCLLALLFATYSCKKGDSTDNNNTNPPITTYQPAVAFSSPQYGAADLFSLFMNPSKTAASIQGAAPNLSFSYEITGSNGMKTAADTTIKGTGTTDASGKATIFAQLLIRYKDGTLTINVRFNNTENTTITSTTKKEEFIIRTYKDILSITDFTGSTLSDTYIQAQDIAFPDTVLTKAPVAYELKANYDGRGFKITNLTIVVPPRTGGMSDFLGLFSFIGKNVTVKNVKLELSATGINTPNDGYCGGIAAFNYGTILNCSVKGTIKGGDWSLVGGLAGETIRGRLIGSSFTGTLESVHITGGLSGSLDSSYVNMCYSNYSVVCNSGGGLIGVAPTHVNGATSDTVFNSYAYIKQATVKSKFYSLFFTGNLTAAQYIYDGCYSNAGIAQTKTISYSTAQELNNLILPLQVSNLPADMTPPPANKPFKNTGDQSQPPVLWWE
ncbi:hypothetical protein FAM09_27470 [Niastella caeni]|uniref:GLUG domain-containing protein n=1 Tax=Niastella caeni TaxID=2569763 RepID=A0A4S8HCK0_9BACT|nr:hypothetical protein [Niastella caeni]THU32533.1 hypothetical protein FAM09_27470 [Niastella caeni]